MLIFIKLDDIKNLHTKVAQEKLVFFYITQPNCNVCHGLLPQIEQIMSTFPNIHCYTVDAAEVPEVASSFHVFTAPTLLLFVEGQEHIRESRFVQTKKFKEKVARIYQNVVIE